MVVNFDRFDRIDGSADLKSYTIPFPYCPYSPIKSIKPIKPIKVEITYKN